MLLADLVEQSSKIAATRSRREKLGLLVDVLRKLSRHEVAAAVAFLSGSLLPGRGGGAGPAREGGRILGEPFTPATASEQDFLTRLLFGELRQGALEGLMEEAIAAAGAVDIAAVRRALMVSGELGAVAEAALHDGGSGLARFALRLLPPLRP